MTDARWAQSDSSHTTPLEAIWQGLVELCPPEHIAILEMKRRGATLEEISERTTLHPESIAWLLRILARQLALQLCPVDLSESEKD